MQAPEQTFVLILVPTSVALAAIGLGAWWIRRIRSGKTVTPANTGSEQPGDKVDGPV